MKTLVAYFSHAGQNYVNGGVAELEHGNAEVLAGFAAQACGGDLFHIERVEPYPAEYKACVKESMAELKVKARPELARDVDVSGYDRVVVVFPNWCGTMPMPCFSAIAPTMPDSVPSASRLRASSGSVAGSSADPATP